MHKSLLSTLLGLALVACGGAQAGTSEPADPVEAVGGGVTAEPSGGGSAGEGRDCDFGGADRYTCNAGLQCCYPREGEVAYGTCMAECPE
ncbi:MAG: hypothetical protein AAGF12_09395 [Myxococcota bacterium]